MNIDWDGKGLPPVGTVCEFDVRGKLFKVKVFAHRHEPNKGPVALFDMAETTEWGFGDACRFSPIQTKEQITAEKREQAVRQMAIVVLSQEKFSVMDGVAALYDAGYRKFEIVEEDV